MSVLDEILTHNARQKGLGMTAGDALAVRKLCVVTCTDPRLTGRLEKALGVGAGDAVIVRIPGASGGADLLRAVATAVLLNGCEEILVLSPSETTVSSDEVLSAMSRRGVPRTALPGDLESFLGRRSNPRQAAVDTASLLRSQPFIPEGVKVHAALIDLRTGLIEALERDEGESQRSDKPSLAALRGLPEGLGVGLEENPLSSGFGPVAFELPHIPPVDVPMTPLELSRTTLRSSGIELKQTIRFGLEIESLKPTELEAPSLDSLPVFTPTPLEAPPVVVQTEFLRPPDPVSAEARPKAQSERPARPRPGPRPGPRKSRPDPSRSPERPRASAPLPAGLASKVEKVRGFYLAEVAGTKRLEVRKALTSRYESGATNAELAKIAIAPILELGQKRYKVIDELIAVKDAANDLDRPAYYSMLLQLVQ